ncbi:hypothetical protein Hdeb2414_s0003g00114461 [Helianthus debilis subsp. tardiflorus]
MKFPLQCFSKITTGTTGLLTAPDSVQGGSGVVTKLDLTTKQVTPISHNNTPQAVGWTSTPARTQLEGVLTGFESVKLNLYEIVATDIRPAKPTGE